ncbi:hypothetical protein TrVFT333_010767 [Trichoderma virens FT-333]|nr:hypothetical protein TrVFT333_010767 [Trichoderma virens FT-333]
MSGSQSTVYSQGFNFQSFLQKGVDPRTGQYTCTVNLYETPAHIRNVATFTLSVSFNPLNTQDVGLGIGWAFNLSAYDHRDRKTLSLSTGECYQATETATGLLVKDQKLKNFYATKVGSNYQIAYKSGLIEILSNANNTYKLSVPITITGANGRALDLVWSRNGDQPRLSKLQDNGEDLVSIEYSEAQVTITRAPNTSEESTFTLVRRNAQLASIELPTDTKGTTPWRFTYESFSNGFLGLSQVTSPTGLIEQVVYQPEGHRLPKGAPYATIPYVVSYVVRPGRQQPAMINKYSYSPQNFLGYDGGRDWSKTGDTLYLVPAEYEYTTTVQVDGGASTTYHYNKFHLTTQIVRQQNTKTVTQTITYYATLNTEFDLQPSQYQLPRSVAIIYADNSSKASRTETTTTEFDAWGNPTQEVKPDGLSTTRTYYISDGEGDDCPADPHGFQRYLKTETVRPAESDFAAPTRVERFTYLPLATAQGAPVDNFVLLKQRTTALDGATATMSMAQYAYVDQPATRDHGRMQQLKTWVSTDETATTQTWAYAYPATEGTLQTTLTTTSCDNVTAIDKSEYLLSSGLLAGQTDAAGVQDSFEYDKLGRCVRATTAIGTSQEATRCIGYTINEDGVGSQVSVIDAKGVQTKYLTDGLERVCQVQRQDDDGEWDATSNIYSGTFRPVKEHSYNAQGQMVEIVDIDWLRTSGENAQPSEQRSSKQLEYDDWGQVCKNTDTSTGVISLSVTDQIALTQTVGIQGEGQTRTTLNLSGVPTQIELLLKDGTKYSQVQYRYDGLGRLVEEEDASGNKTVYKSDDFDRVYSMAWPNGRAVEVQYATQSAAALPTSVQINGVVLGEQTFDGLDRLVQKSVGGRTLRQAYQSSSPGPVQITTQNSDTFALTYEPGLPHLLAKSVGTDGEDDYSYDSSTGELLQFKSPIGSLERQCFPSGLLKVEQTSIGLDASFISHATYSMKGKLQTYTDVYAQEYCHGYDAAGRLSTLVLGTLQLSYSYGPGNRVASTTVKDMEHSIGLATAFTYDDFGREVERVVSQGDQQLYRLSQSYGITGLIATRSLEDGNGTAIREDSFEYDVHSRLVSFTSKGDESQLPADEKGHRIQSQQFTLDNLDNIRSVITTFNDGKQDVATYAYNNDDDPAQVTQITHTHPDFPTQITLAYNANGCLTQDEKCQMLAYDSASRLKSVRDSSGQIISRYDYDAAGRLIRQSVPNQPDTHLFYREDQLIGIQTGDTQTSYLADSRGYWGQVSKANNKAQVQLWVADGHGSILSWMTPSESNQVNQQSYAPYGYSPLNTGVSIAFNGQWRDPVTGWYHLGNGYRVYNPVLGRFHVPDPSCPFITGEINHYAYCAGDPINRIDPSGQFSFFGMSFDWGDLIKAIVGLVVSVVVGVLTAGASTAIEVGVGITAGVAASAAASPVADLAAGRKPTWRSVAISALNGLVDGILGEAGGRLLSAGFKAVSNFKTLIGRAGLYTLDPVVHHSLGATFRDAIKDALPSELVGHVAEGLYEIDPFPESETDSRAAPSPSANHQQQQLKLSSRQDPSVLSRQASLAKDQIRLALQHSQSTLVGERSGQLPQRGQHPWSAAGRFGSAGSGRAGSSVAGILNRPLQCTFGPVGSSQGKRQTTGSRALEALEKKRRMDDALRNAAYRTLQKNYRGTNAIDLEKLSAADERKYCELLIDGVFKLIKVKKSEHIEC